MTKKEAARRLKELAGEIHDMLKKMEGLVKEVDPEEKAESCWIKHIEDSILNLQGWISLMSKEGEKMKKVYRYEGEYGVLEVDMQKIKVITDELNREKIWDNAGQKYINRQNIYAGIIGELFGEDIAEIFPPRYKNECWRGAPTDLGFKAINDEIELVVDEEGTFIYDKDGWILSYAPEYY